MSDGQKKEMNEGRKERTRQQASRRRGQPFLSNASQRRGSNPREIENARARSSREGGREEGHATDACPHTASKPTSARPASKATRMTSRGKVRRTPTQLYARRHWGSIRDKYCTGRCALSGSRQRIADGFPTISSPRLSSPLSSRAGDGRMSMCNQLPLSALGRGSVRRSRAKN